MGNRGSPWVKAIGAWGGAGSRERQTHGNRHVCTHLDRCACSHTMHTHPPMPFCLAHSPFVHTATCTSVVYHMRTSITYPFPLTHMPHLLYLPPHPPTDTFTPLHTHPHMPGNRLHLHTPFSPNPLPLPPCTIAMPLAHPPPCYIHIVCLTHSCLACPPVTHMLVMLNTHLHLSHMLSPPPSCCRGCQSDQRTESLGEEGKWGQLG